MVLATCVALDFLLDIFSWFFKMVFQRESELQDHDFITCDSENVLINARC